MQDYVVIDLEMTGLNPKQDKIIEVGAVRIRNHKIEAELSILVNPHRPLNEKVKELTGISDEDLMQGMEIENALEQTLRFLGEDVLVGHNIIFDYSFLKQEAVNQRKPFEKSGVDTLKLARRFLPAEQKKTLEALCSHYEIERNKGHRASYDAEMTWKLYEHLIADYEKNAPDMFTPKALQYKVKRQTPATRVQKNHLKELIDYHKINTEVPWESLTKSEASRITDRILSTYGRMGKKDNSLD